MALTAAGSPRALNTKTPANAVGIDPTQSHLTSWRLTVPARRCTREPTGFMTAAATRSLETAVSGGIPKNRTSTGVISAPPPMPVRPTTIPMPRQAAVRSQSISTVGVPFAMREQEAEPGWVGARHSIQCVELCNK